MRGVTTVVYEMCGRCKTGPVFLLQHGTEVVIEGLIGCRGCRI